MQDNAWTHGVWLMWFITAANPEHTDSGFVARAHTSDHTGGTYLSGTLVADTLGELRAQLPAGLTCYERASIYPPEVIEAWD